MSRQLRIAAFLTKYRNAGIFSGMDAVNGKPAPLANLRRGEGGTPEQFVDDLEAMGPTFIKVGQLLSTRADLVPPAYMAALERMQNDVAAIGIDEVRGQIEAELGVRVSSVFLELSETPIGSASLAQVHRGRLRDGREVAVKVQRPGVAEAILEDMEILAALARTADRVTTLGRRLHFADWVHEFSGMLQAELDYRQEADNLERFARHFEHDPRLCVPLPLRDLSGRRVLVMTLVDGMRIADVPDVRRIELDMRGLAESLLRGYLDQVFVHGDLHADPHPGNVLVTADDRLALVDFGMVAHVAPRLRMRLLRLLLAAVDGRGETVADILAAASQPLRGFVDADFSRDVSRVVARYSAHGRSGLYSEGRMFFDMVRLATEHGLRTPPELSLFGKTLLNLESVCDALDSGLDRRALVSEHLQGVVLRNLRKGETLPRMAGEFLELQTIVGELPGLASRSLSVLADNRLRVHLAGLEKSPLLDNLQKIANRISAGIVTASLVVASAMLMREERLFAGVDYAALVAALFVIAGLIGIGTMLSALIDDRRTQRHRDSGEDASGKRR